MNWQTSVSLALTVSSVIAQLLALQSVRRWQDRAKSAAAGLAHRVSRREPHEAATEEGPPSGERFAGPWSPVVRATTLTELTGELADYQVANDRRITRLSQDGLALAGRVRDLETQADAAAESAMQEAGHAQRAERMVLIGGGLAILALLPQAFP